MKRIISVILLCCALLTLSACGRKHKEETGLLRIGVLEPMSGEYAAQGLREALGVQYANNEKPTVRLNGKTYRIDLMIADNESDPVRSAEAAQELVDAGCAVVIGSYGAELSKAASDVFLRAGVPAIAASCDDPSVTSGNDHYFRIGALPELQGSVLASFAKKKLGVKCVYCLIRSGSGEDAALARSFRSTAEALGIKVVTAEFPANTVDFTPYLSAAREEDAGAIYAPCEIQYGQLLIGQMELTEKEREDKKSLPPVLADARWQDKEILNALEEKAVSVYSTAAYAEGGNAQFDESFVNWLRDSSEAFASNGANDIVSAESVLGYDAYYTALAAVESAGSADHADILAILPSVSHDGVSGSVSFDADGGAVRSGMWVLKAAPKTQSWESMGQVKAG